MTVCAESSNGKKNSSGIKMSFIGARFRNSESGSSGLHLNERSSFVNEAPKAAFQSTCNLLNSAGNKELKIHQSSQTCSLS